MIKRIWNDEPANTQELQLKRFFSRKMLRKYEPSYAANVFFTTFGPYSMSYFFYEEWLSAAIGQHAGDVNMLFGLDDLLKAMQL